MLFEIMIVLISVDTGTRIDTNMENRMKRISPFISIFLVMSMLLSMFVLMPIHPAHAGATNVTAATDSLLMFIENVGQFNENALFHVRSREGTLWLAENALWVTIADSQPSAVDNTPGNGTNIKLTFPGSNPHPHLEPFNRLDTHVSFFFGRDPENWHTSVPVWGGVRYRNMYPGIDLEITSENGRLVQRIVARDHKHLEFVRLFVEGAESTTLDGNSLILATSVGEYRLPLFTVNGSTDKQLFSPTILENQIISPFSYPQDDPTRSSLRTDTADLIYSTYLGGTNDDQGNAIAVDSSGAAYITGQTASSDFPATIGDTTYNSGTDAFIAKLSADGSTLIYATFLGGNSEDKGNDIAVDTSGAAYITGQTASSDFPATIGDTTYNGGTDAFIAKLSADGSTLTYATFLGGNSEDKGNDIAVDTSGAAYITGQTASSDFPATIGDTTYNGGTDAFIAKLSADGSTLTYATFLGGNSEDKGNDIAVDTSGAAYITGQTASSDFPATIGDTTYNGGTDAFIAKLSADGSTLTYATFLGGSNFEIGNGIAINSVGSAYVTGSTHSTDFPTTLGAFSVVFGGVSDAFVTKINVAGSTLEYSTFLGGYIPDYGNDIVVDATGTAYVMGITNSNNFPITSWGYDVTYNGYSDVFLVKMNNSGSALEYATYLGSPHPDDGYGITVDTYGTIYCTGMTGSSEFPTTSGAYDTEKDTPDNDAFILKLKPSSSPPPPTILTATIRSAGAYDGWILESTETSNVGGTLDRTSPTFILGDGAQDKQYRAILSFNTGGLPDNAVITKVTLKIRRQGVLGTNPFNILGRLMVDIRKPFFGTFYGLEARDFQAAASKNAVALFGITPVNYWYSAFLNATGRAYVNKTGVTQFRLRFYKDDNNDNAADYMRFYSGNYSYAPARPTLIIQYYIP